MIFSKVMQIRAHLHLETKQQCKTDTTVIQELIKTATWEKRRGLEMDAGGQHIQLYAGKRLHVSGVKLLYSHLCILNKFF